MIEYIDEQNSPKKHHLSGMYQDWFLDYASYVILERAVPHLSDGLKPVQRRILHAMKGLDDGRYNKVANIIGNTMQYHPHGDASIGDALVQLGQKDLLIDCQGNWGNILTGDGAAAARYIEARLSKFALEVLFNAKTTNWKLSYDGRNREPINLPVKFPLVLAQGVEGIAVGLSSKILPHNFNELLEASIACLRGEAFTLYPDFLTEGLIDVSKYNDGERGGQIKVRSRIEKRDNRTLVIRDLPFGRTTSSLIDSILRANDKGKIKIRKVDDNTADVVEILVHLASGVSSDKTIDALYAFSDCEISLSPNCCIVANNKPHFLTVSDLLRDSVVATKQLLKLELEIERGELTEQLLFSSLEKIFIEERIYKDKEFENSGSMEEAVKHIDLRLEPFKAHFSRTITSDDILRLMEIKMGRILRFNKEKAQELINRLGDRIKEIEVKLGDMVKVTIDWFAHLKTKYGHLHPRKTELRSFDTIDSTKVVEANEKLYINREEGFIGTDLKRDEYICNCSDIDDIIIFYKDGKYKIVKVSEKMFVGKNVIHLNVFRKNDTRTIYNVVYRDGKEGLHYMKRFAVTGVSRDKVYDLSQGSAGSRIVHFTANSNGEVDILRVTFKPKLRMKVPFVDKDFAEVPIKGRAAMGNILTKNEINRITLKEKGASTLGGRKVWFDADVNRLNYDGRGELLGEFQRTDQILVVLQNGNFYTTNFDESNHYEGTILRIEKFDANKTWTAALWNGEQRAPYLKRFGFEQTTRKLNLLGDHDKSTLYLLTDTEAPRLELQFGGADSFRPNLLIEAAEFIGRKGYSARGARLTKYNVAAIRELEPLQRNEVEADAASDLSEGVAED